MTPAKAVALYAASENFPQPVGKLGGWIMSMAISEVCGMCRFQETPCS